MIIERKKDLLRITIEKSNIAEDIQSAMDYLRYLELTSKAKKVRPKVANELAEKTNAAMYRTRKKKVAR